MTTQQDEQAQVQKAQYSRYAALLAEYLQTNDPESELGDTSWIDFKRDLGTAVEYMTITDELAKFFAPEYVDKVKQWAISEGISDEETFPDPSGASAPAGEEPAAEPAPKQTGEEAPDGEVPSSDAD